MTALDELNEIKELVNNNKHFKYKNIVNFNCESIEKSLKALEIIKKKNVVIRVIKCCKTVEMYNTFAFDEEYFKDKDYARKLTEEEFKLLKEVLE